MRNRTVGNNSTLSYHEDYERHETVLAEGRPISLWLSLFHQGRSQFFVKTLKEYKIEVLVDVRSRPTGRNASFTEKALRNRIAREEVGYLWLGADFLGLSAIREKDTAWILQAMSL